MTRKRTVDRETLREAADWLYDVCGLYDDEDLDPENAVAVIKRAYTSSDCDDFAWILNLMTGWPFIRATWQISDWGFGHHSLVRFPDGRLLDVRGLADEDRVAKRCCRRKGVDVKFTEVAAKPLNDFGDFDEDGFESDLRRLATIVRNLPYAPFNTPAFLELSMRPLDGVDRPHPQAKIDAADATENEADRNQSVLPGSIGSVCVKAEDVVYYCLSYPDGVRFLYALAFGNAVVEADGQLTWKNPVCHEPDKSAFDALKREGWVREIKASYAGPDGRQTWVITDAGREAARMASSVPSGRL